LANYTLKNRRPVVIELEPVLGRKLLLDDPVDWMFKVFSGKPLHVARDTAVVLGEEPLLPLDTLFLEVVVLVVVQPLAALVATGRPPPGEVLTLRVRLALVIGQDQLRSQLLAHEVLDRQLGLSKLVGSLLSQRLVLREDSERIDEVKIIVILSVLVPMKLHRIWQIGKLDLPGRLFLNVMRLQVEKSSDLLRHELCMLILVCEDEVVDIRAVDKRVNGYGCEALALKPKPVVVHETGKWDDEPGDPVSKGSQILDIQSCYLS
jgi:hypothetical protein